MDPGWKRGLTLALLLLIPLLAGCVGDNDKPSAAAQLTGPATSSPAISTQRPLATTVPTDVLSKVDNEAAVFVPAWELGQWWRYDVSGRHRPDDTATLVVSEVADDHYSLSSDSTFELGFNVIHDGPFISYNNPSVEKATLSVFHDDRYNDLIGFTRPLAATWDLSLFDTLFTITKVAVRPINTPAGPFLGIHVNGTATNGYNIEIEYAANAEWLSKLAIANATGVPLVTYTLTGFGPSGAPEAMRWDITDRIFSGSQSPFYPVDANIWDADGDGTEVFLAVRLQSYHPEGQATFKITAPDGTVVFDETLEEGLQWYYLTAPVMPGRWVFASLSLGLRAPAAAYADAWAYEFRPAE